jgi:hypothetical protein
MTLEQIASIGACRQFEREFYDQHGLALGLVIAQKLAELHFGQLTIKTAKRLPLQQCSSILSALELINLLYTIRFIVLISTTAL